MLALGGNCEACTPDILNAIEQFNGKADEILLQEAFAIPCACKNKWLEEKTRVSSQLLTDRIETILDILDAPL